MTLDSPWSVPWEAFSIEVRPNSDIVTTTTSFHPTFAPAIGGVMTEYQARFLVTSVQMLATWSQQTSPITKIKVVGVLIGHDQNGSVIMPAPVDYVSWTPRIAGFATDPSLLAMQNRVRARVQIRTALDREREQVEEALPALAHLEHAVRAVAM
jgi:hypothetical protein